MAVDFAFRTCGWLAGVFALNCSVFFLILDAEWFAVVYYMLESCLLVAVYPCFFVSPRRWDAVHGDFFFGLRASLCGNAGKEGM